MDTCVCLHSVSEGSQVSLVWRQRKQAVWQAAAFALGLFAVALRLRGSIHKLNSSNVAM